MMTTKEKKNMKGGREGGEEASGQRPISNEERETPKGVGEEVEKKSRAQKKVGHSAAHRCVGV